MGFKFRPVAYGNHNNIHFKMNISHKQENLVCVKIIAFPDTEKAYIVDLSINETIKRFININSIYEVISHNLSKNDFKLVLTDRNNFSNTEELLNYINDERNTN